MRWIVVLAIICQFSSFGQQFQSEQLRYSRVREAKAQTDAGIRQRLSELDVPYEHPDLYIRGFKWEQEMECWLRNRSGEWVLFHTYDFCQLSGVLGPKVRQGDGQVPEGFYHIDRFNPASNFHLSMGINYPNQVDRKRAGSHLPGGDIFIHGACVTIGCIPITDEGIQELYWLAVLAKSGGQAEIPVHLFPCHRSSYNPLWHAAAKTSLVFWNTLWQAERIFDEERRLPIVSLIDSDIYRVQ